MITPKIQFKRGNTFLFSASATDTAGGPIDITGWTIKSQVRNALMALIADAVVTITDAAGGVYEVLIANTDSWVPREIYVLDIKYTDGGGIIMSTETLYIYVLEDVTQ